MGNWRRTMKQILNDRRVSGQQSFYSVQKFRSIPSIRKLNRRERLLKRDKEVSCVTSKIARKTGNWRRSVKQLLNCRAETEQRKCYSVQNCKFTLFIRKLDRREGPLSRDNGDSCVTLKIARKMGNRRTTAKQLLSFRTGSEQQQIYLIENSTPTLSVWKSNRRERLKLKQKSQIASL